MMDKVTGLIQRYTAEERLNHWVVAIAFVLLLLSGLAFYHPSMFWLTNLFGGGTLARVAHPFIGLLMAVSFAALAVKLWPHNKITEPDVEWLHNVDKVMAGHEEFSQDIGRYNGGQKRLFQLMVLTVGLLLLSGIVMWRPYIAGSFHIDLVRLATLTHSVAATALIFGFILHIYATFWVKGTLRAMIRGNVTQGWAKKHHPGWFREQTK